MNKQNLEIRMLLKRGDDLQCEQTHHVFVEMPQGTITGGLIETIS